METKLYIIKIQEDGSYKGVTASGDSQWSAKGFDNKEKRFREWQRAYRNDSDEDVSRCWFKQTTLSGRTDELLADLRLKSVGILIYRGEKKWEYRFREEVIE